MSKVKTAVLGNALSSLATLLAIILTIVQFEIFDRELVMVICLFCMLIGSVIGLILATKVKMIQMPELVALLNGIGGAASAIVGGCALITADNRFALITSMIALVIGMLTFTGSLIAALKLAKLMNGRPVILKGHQGYTMVTLALMILSILLMFIDFNPMNLMVILVITALISAGFGILFSIRVGGADMPITISLLNSLSGVAGSIAGMAIGDLLLVSVGGIVGASGLLLTQMMCKAMNRQLFDILLSKKSTVKINQLNHTETISKPLPQKDIQVILKEAKKVIIVPGYGMALAQAQRLVKQLTDSFEKQGSQVKYAIHPVAGRMPGHMNVLLCEVDVDYEQLYELNEINDAFKDCDVCIVVGANDVLNPAAREAEGTPIYGMPILNVDEAKHVIICNYDTKPGYAGVKNPLYQKEGVHLLLGDAKDSLASLIEKLKKTELKKETQISQVFKDAKEVIIVPGYGMALAQAQQLVKQLADQFEKQGSQVKYAIHPVAGRMPGHMNVLLCEVDVDYEQLYELNEINDAFKNCDVCIVVGANDVLNPAAREAEGTPIYGMPILNVDEAKHVIICNFDTKPGYAGVKNPLYQKEGVHLLLGDAKDSLQTLLSEFNHQNQVKPESNTSSIKEAKKVIIVPGYGMALAQAQRLVKQLADSFEKQGSQVKYAIHPVAGRMPGHMNVLLCEVDVDYEQLYELNEINDEFKDCDVCIVVGANDVLNPAAREAEGTPIYGMPILNVDEAKHVIICNYDTKPGYAGVLNPLYQNEKVRFLCGDAKDSLQTLIEELK
jgi:H+-translocating NAD(P) transhydrogenase subunit beta